GFAQVDLLRTEGLAHLCENTGRIAGGHYQRDGPVDLALRTPAHVDAPFRIGRVKGLGTVPAVNGHTPTARHESDDRVAMHGITAFGITHEHVVVTIDDDTASRFARDLTHQLLDAASAKFRHRPVGCGRAAPQAQ